MSAWGVTSLAADALDAVEGYGKAGVVLAGGGAVAWLTVKLLWRFQADIEQRYEGLLTKYRADIDRLTGELAAERASCHAEIAELKAQVAELRRRSDRPPGARTRREDHP